MKNLILLNRLGFNPDLTTRQSRVDSVSIASRYRVLAILLLCLTLFVGSGNVWGATGSYSLSGSQFGTSNVSNYSTSEATLTGSNSSSWKVKGYGVIANTSLSIGKGGANYLKTPVCPDNITSIVVTWTGNASYYLALQTTSGTELEAKKNTSSAQTYTFKVSGSYTQLQLVGRRSSGTSNAEAKITSVTVNYGSSCTSLTMSAVTATPGNGRIDLSWPVVNNASSYTVTCKRKSDSSTTGISIGSVSGSGPKTCAITGLTNGTEYTWSVMPVGTGSYCADNTPATGDATPNVSRTITYFDKDGSHTTSLADGTNIATALTALYGGDDPVSCDATNYEYFVGWKVGEISGTASSVTLLDDEEVNASSPSNNYYAVWSDTDPSSGGWKQVTSLTIGDEVVFVYNGTAKYEMTGVASNLGTATYIATIPDDIAGTFTMTIEKGYNNTGYSFKNGTKYIRHNADKKIELSTTKDALSSWTPSGSSGNFKLNNNSNTSYNLQFNSGSPRWTDYSSNQSAFQIYKRASGGTVNYITTCCSQLGTINGSVTLSQSGTSVTVKDWTYTQGGAAAESNIATYDVYLYSDADSYADPIQTQTCAYNAKATGVTFTSLSYGTTYKIKIGATGNTNYCDITPIQVTTINSTSTQTFQLACDVPTNVAASSITASSATVSWDDVATNYQYVLDQSSSDPAGAGTAVNGAHSVDLSTLSPSTTYYFHVRTNCGNSVFSSWATISFNTPAATCSSYSFHDGTNGSSDWQINCFEYSGNTDRQWIKDITIRNKSHYYVGKQGNFYNDGLGNKNAKSYTNQMQYMQLALDRDHGGNNQLGTNYAGVQGTLLCYDNSPSDNLYVDFLPGGYYFVLDATGTPTALPMTCTNPDMTAANILNSNTVWETEIQTVTNVSNKYTVGIKADATIAGKAWQTTRYNTNEDMTTLKKRNSSGGFTGTLAAADVTAGTRGKYRIWANNFSTTSGEKNWYAHFVPYFRITYDGSGASGSTDPSADVSCEGNDAARTVVAAANGFTVPTGKSFGGWASSPENAAAGVVAYAAGANVVLTSSITLYAIWTDINYTVTVNQSPDVSATTTGQTSTAHYNGTINLTTTIPDGYRFVNWTTSDGFSITNPTSATTASFTMPAKNVTVTANFQQTHTVDWYVGGSAPANKIGDDGQTTVVDHGGKIEDFPATTPDGSACDKVFVGWTNTSSYVHGTSLLFTDAAGSPTINADASFYAVFAAGGDTEDEITVDETGATAESSAYESWSDVSISSDAIYAGNTAGGSSGNASVQMRSNNSNSGIVTTSSGGKVTKVIVDWNSSSANGRTLDIYGKNTAYTEATDLYDNSTQGTKLGSIVNGTSTELEISGDYSYIGLRSNSGAMYLNSITISWSSATGHTINCADCGSSVTPTYTAAPTGGTVSVTKSATPVASGSTVKTCTAVDLTVTITPATHYTLTGFTATGLTTGTATISPAVNTVVPTASAQTFTVTVSAGATGTLNLTPTFTPETPLTITLNTNGKGTFTTPTEFPIYAGETFTFPTVTPNDDECATFVGWIAGTTFEGDGTTHDAPVVITAGTVSAAQNANATYTAVFYETETTESDAYVKVTETPANWVNDHYLIVYENGDLAFDGSRTDGDGDKIDAASNTVAVSITSSAIAATNALAASEWKIASMTGGYSIQSASGKYIGNASNSNALSTSSSALVNTLSISSENFEVVSEGGAYLRYNATSGQERFRYYKSSSYTSQQAIQLYKLGTAVVETRTYTTNPSCTPKYRVTVASVTGGSPNANPKFNPEGEEVTLTANPAAGYTFTGWTLTHTEGGAAASVTYTEGSASTETAVFEMPAYDVTVTASYAKKAVTSLQVKDGETVIPNSGTVNISTGANKTLDVVITPADAFDHSWTATVTAGGTYASISNVTDAGFRVNGLAQGDATVTVTAPNDGSAKVVTFTVHVTDVLPSEIILKRDGSDAPIDALTMYYDAANSRGQYVKVNVSFTPTPTNKDFSVSADGTFVTIHAQAHTNPNYYATLNGNKVTTSPVNVTFTSAATSSVTKNLVVTVLPCPADQFVDYIHGNATVTRAAQVSADHWSISTSITTPTLSDKPESSSADCEAGHYHLIGWLPQSIAEALFEAGTPITSETEGLVTAGAEIEASGTTWYAIWAKKE